MSESYAELKSSNLKIPNDLPKKVVDTINRIENNPSVQGVIFFRNGFVELCTVPLTMIQPLSLELPTLTELVKRAIGEIDVLNELIGYRIRTKTSEITMVVADDVATCAVVKLRRKEGVKTKRRRY